MLLYFRTDGPRLLVEMDFLCAPHPFNFFTDGPFRSLWKDARPHISYTVGKRTASGSEYTNANTQIQLWSKLQIGLTCASFLDELASLDIVNMSTCHLVILSLFNLWHLLACPEILSTCHHVSLLLCQYANMSTCQLVNISTCDIVILSLFNLWHLLACPEFLSSCQLVIISSCHHVSMPKCQHVSLSTCQHVNFWQQFATFGTFWKLLASFAQLFF